MVGALRIGFEFSVEKVGEEKQLQHTEHDQQLDRKQLPESAPQTHGTEAVVVEKADFFQHGESLPFPIKVANQIVSPMWEISSDGNDVKI